MDGDRPARIPLDGYLGEPIEPGWCQDAGTTLSFIKKPREVYCMHAVHQYKCLNSLTINTKENPPILYHTSTPHHLTPSQSTQSHQSTAH
jgi:hypothetical protein